ncbi:HTTM domain-containing protein [Bdellovibrio sp. 22V]|uniref:HTTM domain-containing protein n=1 Tax=Bdellovibrio TaxID=958 RepID=UPI002542E8E9|nr:HTTM domain-containing protein [Bdellovibrio sp. 22V]WII72369.1 HTTM domain-containing protein [Bdellovibrio sp. 22V]
MKLKTITNSLHDFFFKPAPVHTVALLRVALGIILLFNWISIWDNLEFFWGVDGVMSLKTAIKYGHSYRFNLFELLPNKESVPVFLALLNLVGVVGMLFGFFTRTSIAITLFTLLSFHNRNIFVLNSSDVVIRNFLFLLLLSRSGDWLSLDRWLLRLRGLAPEIPEDKAPWALRLMQLQICVIYIATVMFKLKGAAWVDGTAVYIATRLDEFVRVPLGLLNHLAVIKFLTWSTLAVELSLGTLIWVRELRYWVLLAGVGLHLGIEITMNIPLFEWVMIATMISMVPAEDVKKVVEGFRWRLPLRLSRRKALSV